MATSRRRPRNQALLSSSGRLSGRSTHPANVGSNKTDSDSELRNPGRLVNPRTRRTARYAAPTPTRRNPVGARAARFLTMPASPLSNGTDAVEGSVNPSPSAPESLRSSGPRVPAATVPGTESGAQDLVAAPAAPGSGAGGRPVLSTDDRPSWREICSGGGVTAKSFTANDLQRRHGNKGVRPESRPQRPAQPVDPDGSSLMGQQPYHNGSGPRKAHFVPPRAGPRLDHERPAAPRAGSSISPAARGRARPLRGIAGLAPWCPTLSSTAASTPPGRVRAARRGAADPSSAGTAPPTLTPATWFARSATRRAG